MHSSAGPASNVNSTSTVAPRGGPATSAVPPATSQPSNAVRAPVKAPLTTANRPNSNVPPGQQQQQQRGNGGYYQQNNRGNYSNGNPEQDPNSARRSGTNVATAPAGHQVFVGSLPLEFTNETLMEVFGKYGTVLDAKIHTPNNETKKVCHCC